MARRWCEVERATLHAIIWSKEAAAAVEAVGRASRIERSALAARLRAMLGGSGGGVAGHRTAVVVPFDELETNIALVAVRAGFDGQSTLLCSLGVRFLAIIILRNY